MQDLNGKELPRIDSSTPVQVRYLEAILLELQWQRRQTEKRPKNAVKELAK